jgi:hypothetical protein
MEDLAIIRLNIERYFRLLERESDRSKRRQIVALLQQALVEEASGLSSQEESRLQPRVPSNAHAGSSAASPALGD